LAGIAKRLGLKALQEIACIAKPDTILAWYRKLVTPKFDGSKKRGSAARPRVDAAIEEIVVKRARENSGWVMIASSKPWHSPVTAFSPEQLQPAFSSDIGIYEPPAAIPD
jgi:hypothetical protein